MSNTKQSIAKITLALLLGFQVLTVAVILLVNHFWGADAYLKHVRGLMRIMATESIQSVDSLLQPAENLAKTTRSLMESGIISTKVDEDLERYFFEHISNNTNLSDIYFGWTNGDFLYVSRACREHVQNKYCSKFVTTVDGEKRRKVIGRGDSFEQGAILNDTTTYDPRERPWFSVDKTEELRWINPYLYFATHIPGITVASPVVDESGEKIGVLGINIDVSNLSYYLSRNQLSANSSAFIANADYRIVAHTDIDPIMLGEIGSTSSFSLMRLDDLKSQLVTAALDELGTRGGSFMEPGVHNVNFEFNGEAQHAAFHSYQKQGVDWTFVMTAPENDFIGEIRSAQYMKVMIALLLSLTITLLAYFFLARFLKPVSELQESVLRDPLTGLYNRRAFTSLGNEMVKSAHSKGQKVSVAMVDIDHFKKINDSFGHQIGDEVLVSVSQRMSRVLQKTDLLVRYGGEEFALLLFGADLEMAMTACERLRRAVCNDDVLTEKGPVAVSISAGVVEVSGDDDYILQSLSLADQALYDAKDSGRNCVATHEEAY